MSQNVGAKMFVELTNSLLMLKISIIYEPTILLKIKLGFFMVRKKVS